MSADVLRQAAALMRERAEAVTARLTKCERPDECSSDGFCGSPQLADMWPNNAEHIASWHPAVALAVADWLDATARELDALGDPDLSAHPQDGRRTSALAVARAYLGGAA